MTNEHHEPVLAVKTKCKMYADHESF